MDDMNGLERAPAAKARRRGNKKLVESARLHNAFARAAAEDAELRRLKASGRPWACLDFGRDTESVLVPPVGSPTSRIEAVPAADGAADESARAER
jgi:hypothetical protein